MNVLKGRLFATGLVWIRKPVCLIVVLVVLRVSPARLVLSEYAHAPKVRPFVVERAWIPIRAEPIAVRATKRVCRVKNVRQVNV